MPGQEKAEQKADKETENQSWIFPQEPQVPKCGMQQSCEQSVYGSVFVCFCRFSGMAAYLQM